MLIRELVLKKALFPNKYVHIQAPHTRDIQTPYIHIHAKYTNRPKPLYLFTHLNK